MASGVMSISSRTSLTTTMSLCRFPFHLLWGFLPMRIVSTTVSGNVSLAE